MKRILLPILATGVLLLSACGTPTTPPPETVTITPPPETTTITPPPETLTITTPPETITITTPPETITITTPPVTITITPPPVTITITPAPTQIIESLSPQEAFALVQENQNNPDFVIIDVRTAQEFASGYIENAVNIDYYSVTFRDDIDKLDKDKIYFIYCSMGMRSGVALTIMEELGFLEVYHLSGGIVAWNAEGLPVVTE